jgi:hypothetical protein
MVSVHYLRKKEKAPNMLQMLHMESTPRRSKFALHLTLGTQTALFVEDNSIRRNTKTHAWNFSIDDIYDLVAYQEL